MKNQYMQDAVDVSSCPKTPDGDYVVNTIFRPGDDCDYCDAQTGEWVWSIGRNRETGQILASLTARFYGHPEYECVWLR